MLLHPFIEAWHSFTPKAAPFVLDTDAAILKQCKDTVTYSDLDSYVSSEHFDAVDDRCLHLGLLPQPFCGPLERARIYILLLNPGLAPGDYFELEQAEFRSTLIESYRQPGKPFIFLNERFAWHGGFGWWYQKLSPVIGELARRRKTSRSDARKLVARELASIELVPYHSTTFRPRGLRAGQLESAKLARSFVQEVVVPRAQRGDCGIIVTRKANAWGLENAKNIVVYGAAQARSASLGLETEGGQLILEHLQSV